MPKYGIIFLFFYLIIYVYIFILSHARRFDVDRTVTARTQQQQQRLPSVWTEQRRLRYLCEKICYKRCRQYLTFALKQRRTQRVCYRLCEWVSVEWVRLVSSISCGLALAYVIVIWHAANMLRLVVNCAQTNWLRLVHVLVWRSRKLLPFFECLQMMCVCVRVGVCARVLVWSGARLFALVSVFVHSMRNCLSRLVGHCLVSVY